MILYPISIFNNKVVYIKMAIPAKYNQGENYIWKELSHCRDITDKHYPSIIQNMYFGNDYYAPKGITISFFQEYVLNKSICTRYHCATGAAQRFCLGNKTNKEWFFEGTSPRIEKKSGSIHNMKFHSNKEWQEFIKKYLIKC